MRLNWSCLKEAECGERDRGGINLTLVPNKRVKRDKISSKTQSSQYN